MKRFITMIVLLLCMTVTASNVQQNTNDYETIKTTFTDSTDSNFDAISINDIVQNDANTNEQASNYYQGLNFYTIQNHRYHSGGEASRYSQVKSNNRQTHRSCNYKEVETCKIKHSTCWQYDRSGMHSRRAEGIIADAKGNYKPLQAHYRAKRGHYNYTTKVHSYAFKTTYLDRWHSTRLSYWRSAYKNI